MPDLQGRAPMYPGQGPGLSLHNLGETGGSETVTLLESEIPAHNQIVRASADDGDLNVGTTQRSLARSSGGFAWGVGAGNTDLGPQTLTPTGGDQPHNNMQPYLTCYFSIALQGVFPPRP